MSKGNTTKYNITPARPRRIALLSHVMARNGAPMVLLSVAEILKDEGYQIDVFSVVHGPLEEDFKALNINVKVDENLHSTPLANQPWYKDYDLFLVNTAVMAGCFAAPLNGAPAIWWIHEGPVVLKQCGLTRENLSKIYKEKVCTVAVSEVAKEAFLSLRPDWQFDEVIPIGVKDNCTDIFHRKTVNLYGKIVFLTVACGMEPRKGQDVLCEAIERLPKQLRKKSEFWFVGKTGNDAVSKKVLTCANKYPKNVKVMGVLPHDKLLELYRQTDYVVVPSREESLSIVAMEAMMMGIPCVLSDNTGVAKIKGIDETARIFRSEDARELEKNIEWDIRYRVSYQYEQRKDNARRFYETHCSQEKFKDNMTNVVLRTIEQNEHKPLISVVLPVYNGEKYLAGSIESIRWQTFGDWELIIVNDGSTDGSADIIEKYVRKDFRIRVINHDTNKTLPVALNTGFAEARGKLLTWNSDDNIYMPQTFEKMVSFLSKHTEYVAVTGRMNQINDEGLFVRLFDKYNPESMWLVNTMGLCVMYRREVYDTIGGYDENLFLVEDYDYWLRILEHFGKYSIGAINEISYIYRCHKKSLTVARLDDVVKKSQELRRKHLIASLENMKNDIVALHYYYQIFVAHGDATVIHTALKQMKLLPGAEREAFDFPDGEYIVVGGGKEAREMIEVLGNKVKYIVIPDTQAVLRSINGRQIISCEEAILRANHYGAKVVIAASIPQNYALIQELTEEGLKEYRTYWRYKAIIATMKYQQTGTLQGEG